jgi:hypothetical protein
MSAVGQAGALSVIIHNAEYRTSSLSKRNLRSRHRLSKRSWMHRLSKLRFAMTLKSGQFDRSNLLFGQLAAFCTWRSLCSQQPAGP